MFQNLFELALKFSNLLFGLLRELVILMNGFVCGDQVVVHYIVGTILNRSSAKAYQAEDILNIAALERSYEFLDLR